MICDPESGPLGEDHEGMSLREVPPTMPGRGGVSPDLEEAADMGSGDGLGGDPVEQVVIRADPIIAQTILRAVTALGNLYMRMDVDGAAEQRAKLVAAEEAIREGFAMRGVPPVKIRVGKKLLTEEDAGMLDEAADRMDTRHGACDPLTPAARREQGIVAEYLRRLGREAREGNSR
jgi:hypothetical protein